jgi:hypothetical protein
MIFSHLTRTAYKIDRGEASINILQRSTVGGMACTSPTVTLTYAVSEQARIGALLLELLRGR